MSSTANRRGFTRALRALTAVVSTLALVACGGGNGNSAAKSESVGSNLEEIAAKAKEEGEVRLIAYPETWANYKGHFAGFEEKYGVKVKVDSPDASSAEELQAVENLKGQATQPDVLDIGYSFTNAAIDRGLIDPYKPSNWDSIPDHLKDPDGNWVGAYYGVIAIGVNMDKVKEVPKTFADLKDPQYKGQIAIPGDPRQGASSIATVFAASLANGGSLDDIQPGIDFFAELADSGNLVTVSSAAAGLTQGEADIIFDWNYNWLGREEQLRADGVNFQYFVLEDGVFGNYYAQPVTVNSPQPNAARLWVDWLTSDEGAEQYALGGAIPARFTELAEAGKLSDEALASLPDPEIVAQVKLPSAEQGDKANKVIASEWAKKVKM
ncbi:putative spermidine/putrescine transport system substrate-binding protein [Actinobaculum suis]|uniref:2-aminoethylphosphonate ABC transporter substrate-binding protein n=1 Tax=Actinobaculum suis TaxID=1657 RepID=A0A1G7B7V9_9ACTO|nr:extracellular solute-binding protein [Actinobaculum suis]MDY5153633.1 extracellular solute-binding protein [Actinobaculum suis]SDE23103.1 putative spermidine/putrescine transport system substrate-binding protein [Actinobaculum suis]VDG75813.1 2-aminoethylphosphonate ABC transporter substrate-binding protein [Actinobaculum suis]